MEIDIYMYNTVKTDCLINKHVNATYYKPLSMFISLTPNKHVIPYIKYTVKDVFAADTLIDIFMQNNQHCTRKKSIHQQIR